MTILTFSDSLLSDDCFHPLGVSPISKFIPNTCQVHFPIQPTDLIVNVSILNDTWTDFYLRCKLDIHGHNVGMPFKIQKEHTQEKVKHKSLVVPVVAVVAM